MGHIEQICGNLFVALRTIFKILLINIFFYDPNGCTSYVLQILLQLTTINPYCLH